MAESHRHLLLLFDSDIILHRKGLIQVQWFTAHLGVSENSVPLNPMANDHYPVFKWLFHWEYTQHFQTNPFLSR